MRRLGVVVVEPPAQLRRDDFGILELGTVHIIAFECPDEGLGQVVALGLYASIVIGTRPKLMRVIRLARVVEGYGSDGN